MQPFTAGFELTALAAQVLASPFGDTLPAAHRDNLLRVSVEAEHEGLAVGMSLEHARRLRPSL